MKSGGEVNGIRVDAELIEHLEKQHAEPEDSMTGVLRVVVPYTTSDLTRVALRHTAVCSDLDVCVCLVDVQAVPFPCSFDQPLLLTRNIPGIDCAKRRWWQTREEKLAYALRNAGHEVMLLPVVR